MESQQFDAMARAMVGGTTRRKLATLLLGGALAGTATHRTARSSVANRSRRDRRVCCAVACRGEDTNQDGNNCIQYCRADPCAYGIWECCGK
jgi:hypothetical protein